MASRQAGSPPPLTALHVRTFLSIKISSVDYILHDSQSYAIEYSLPWSFGSPVTSFFNIFSLVKRVNHPTIEGVLFWTAWESAKKIPKTEASTIRHNSETN